MDTLLAWAAQHPGWLLALIALVAFLESLALAGIVIPGVALLFALALLAGQSGIPVLPCLGAAIAGAILGDGLSFWLGRLTGPRLGRLWPLSRYPELLDKGQDFFLRHGGKSVVIGRFVGPVRPVIPLVAGSLGMPPRRFLTFNVSSALAWGPFYLLPGYLAGAAFDFDEGVLHSPEMLALSIALGALALGMVAAQLHWHLRDLPEHWPRPAWLVTVCTSLSFVLFSAFHLAWDGLQVADRWLFEAIPATSSMLAHVFLAITLLGDPGYLYPLFGGFNALLWWLGHRRIAITLALFGFVLHGVTHVLKASFDVPRPPGVSYPESLSYPSGHAAGAAFVYGCMAVIAVSAIPARRHWLAGMLVGLGVGLIAGSRMVLGVHYLSDVLGGLLLGASLAGLAALLATRQGLTRQTLLNPGQVRALLIAGVLWAALYNVLFLSREAARYAI